MNVAIIGRTQILYETALLLNRQGHNIQVLVSTKAAPEYTRTEADFQQLAASLKVPFVLANNLDAPEVTELCRGLDIGVSVNWPTIVQEKHIKLFRLGILNAHFGDLPRYRGNACPNWAIIRGESQITSTIHFMEGGEFDCGRIVGQRHFHLDEASTVTDVYSWSEKAIPQLFLEALEKLHSDESYTLKYADQDSADAFRCYPRLPEDGFIDWKTPVASIHNLVRAVCPPFAGAYTYHYYEGRIRKLIVLKSRIAQRGVKDLAVPGQVLRNDKNSGESWVQCGDGTLALDKCRYEDEAEDFSPGRRWKSIRMRLGIRAEDYIYSRGAHVAHAHPRPLLIFPCNGNGIEALDCLGEAYRCVAFVDDAAEKQGTQAHGYPVLARTAFAEHPDALVLAVPGSPASYRDRKKIIEGLGLSAARFARVIHPAARISPLAVIGQNVLIMAGVVITSNASVGDHVCVLPNTVIHHDAVVGDWSLVGSTVTIAGAAAVGRNCYIGGGSSIKNGVRVEDGALVGLGSNVVRSVAAGAVVAGNPAR